MTSPIVSIIYVYYNTPEELEDSVSSVPSAVRRYTYEIIIVDNASKKKIPETVRKKRNVTVIRNEENLGYGAGHNVGVKKSRGKYLLFVNTDTVFHKQAISLMVKKMQREHGIGLLGPQMQDAKGIILPTISGPLQLPDALFAFSFLNRIFPWNPWSKRYWLNNLDRDKEQDVGTIGGACMLIKKSLFERIGGFDERFFMYFEEADLSRRVIDAGQRVKYFPKAKITHFVARSSGGKAWILRTYERSRFLYFKKYYGIVPAVLTEGIFRLLTVKNILVLSILLLSAFLNLYRMHELMLFIGDAARDYLAARDMIATGNIPLVGIPSSVTWLHQGPLSVYLIGIAFLLGKFHPVAPAVLFGLIGAATTLIVYAIGRSYFNPTVGLLAAVFFATSPMVVVNARMPYHTALIPFFASLFFLLLYKVIQGNKKLILPLFFSFGLLLQTELSNAVVVVILAIVFFFIRHQFTRHDVIKGLSGFGLGALPFIIYDITNGFPYSVLFPLWILNRIRLFFGLTLQGHSTTANLPNAVQTTIQQLTSTINPSSIFIAGLVIALIAIVVFKHKAGIFPKKKPTPLSILLLWTTIPLVGFLLHAAPGTAYFPLIFPSISLLIGYAFYYVFRRVRFSILFLIFIVVSNIYLLLQQDFFVTTKNNSPVMPPFGYSFGTSWRVSDEVVRQILADAKGEPLTLKGAGFMAEVPTTIDTYKYLLWWRGGKEGDGKTYVLFTEKTDIPKGSTLIYHRPYTPYVARFE